MPLCYVHSFNSSSEPPDPGHESAKFQSLYICLFTMDSQNSSEELSSVSDKHPKPGPSDDEQLSDDEDTASVYFEASSRPPTPTQHCDLKRELVRDQQERGEIVELFSTREPLPSPESIARQIKRMRVTLALGAVINEMTSKYAYRKVRRMARHALSIARDLDDEILIAQCTFWLGRIELDADNFKDAFEHFKAARPCVMDDDCLEGAHVEFYKGISWHGLRGEYRERMMLEHYREILGLSEKEYPADAVPKTSRRKRSAKTWDFVVRLSPEQLRPAWVRRLDRRKLKQQRDKSTAWMVYNTGDLPQYRNAYSVPQSNKAYGDGMKWLEVPQGHPRLERRRFTFCHYHRGLAPRTRPTNIFPIQPWEFVLSDEQSEIYQRWSQRRRVTMSFLAFEREMFERLMRIRKAKASEKQTEPCEASES